MFKQIILILTFFLTYFYAIAGAEEYLSAPEDPIELDKIIVTYSRMAQHDYKIAGNVSVIDRAQIEASNARTLPDILKQELGVHMVDNGTVKSSVIDIRGFGDTASRNILVLVNDRRMNTVDLSGPDLSAIPLDSVERIEILRGAGSVLYGDNAVGGVVNIITKRGRGKMHGKIGSSYGDYDTIKGNMELSGASHNVGYNFYGQYYDTNGLRENNDLTAYDYNTRLDYRVSEHLGLDLDVGWHQDELRLPGGLNFAELASLGRLGTANPNDYASSKDRYVKMTFDVSPWPEDMDWGHLVTDVSYRNRDSYAWFDFGSFGATATKRNINTLGITSKYVFNQELFNREVNFVTGVDYYNSGNDIKGGGSGSSTSADDLTISKEEIAGYTYAELELFEHLFLNGGARYQQAYYTFDRRDTLFYDTHDPKENVYMLGSKYEYAKGSNVHLSAQQTFRFLATDEWYDTFAGLNTSLQQQTGVQFELGVKHNIHDKAQLTLTSYVIENKNEIFFDPVTVFFGSNRNYDRTQRIGQEVGLRTDLAKYINVPFFDKMELFSNYNHQDPRFQDGVFNKKDIPMAPRHMASGGMDTEFLKHYKLSLIGNYIGEQFAINDTLNATPPIKEYYTMDAKVGYHTGPWEVYWGVNNFTNVQYNTFVVKSSTSTNKDFFPAPGRNFVAGMNLKF